MKEHYIIFNPSYFLLSLCVRLHSSPLASFQLVSLPFRSVFSLHPFLPCFCITLFHSLTHMLSLPFISFSHFLLPSTLGLLTYSFSFPSSCFSLFLLSPHMPSLLHYLNISTLPSSLTYSQTDLLLGSHRLTLTCSH